MKIAGKWNQLRDLALLAFVQLSNLLIPLLLTPHLSRVLTKNEFGQYISVLSLALTLSILVEYGFSFSGVRAILQTNDASLVFSSILGAKVLLSIAALLIAILISIFSSQLATDLPMYVFGVIYGILLGLSPFWYFQAIMNLRNISLIDLGFKLASMLAIFWIVRRAGQGELVFAIQVVSVTMFLGWSYLHASKTVVVRKVSFRVVLTQLKDGWQIFSYKLMAASYTTGNLALFRLFFPSDFVAVYSNGERVVNASKSFIGPMTQVYFPRVTLVLQDNRERAFLYFLRITAFTFGISFIIWGFLSFFADEIILLMFGEQYKNSIPILKILLLGIFPVAGSASLAYFWLIPNGRDRLFNYALTFAAVCNIVLLSLYFKNFADFRTAILNLILESIVFLILLSSIISREHRLIFQLLQREKNEV